ncbi:Signal peptidase, peptidase S26 [Musa troglodytarum]|nr:Signal peptidase, peptidase S26 [Musa troglodytarum]
MAINNKRRRIDEAGDGEGLEAKARRIERFRSGDAHVYEIDGAGIFSPVLFDAWWGLERSYLRMSSILLSYLMMGKPQCINSGLWLLASEEDCEGGRSSSWREFAAWVWLTTICTIVGTIFVPLGRDSFLI